MSTVHPFTPTQEDHILDAALRHSASIGWDALHLHELAQDVSMDLALLAEHVPDKHWLGQRLFDRADRSLVACADRPRWREQGQLNFDTAEETLGRNIAAFFESSVPAAQVCTATPYAPDAK